MGDKRNERAREKMQALLITGMTWHRITTSPAFGQKNSKQMSGETVNFAYRDKQFLQKMTQQPVE